MILEKGKFAHKSDLKFMFSWNEPYFINAFYGMDKKKLIGPKSIFVGTRK